MSLDIPNLDDLTYEALIDELVRSVPRYSAQWTDFNPSDPGITLLQMLSWIGQSLLYRANTISDQSYYNYLQLLAGEGLYRPVDSYQLALLEILHRWPMESTPGTDQYGQPHKVPKARTQAEINEIEAIAQAYWQVNNRAIAEVDYYALGLEAYFNELVLITGQTSNKELQYRQQSLSHLQQLRRLFVRTNDQVQLNPSLLPKQRNEAQQNKTQLNEVVEAQDKIQDLQENNKPLKQQQWIELIVNIAADLPYVLLQDKPENNPQAIRLLAAIKNFVVPRRPVGTLIKVRLAHYTQINLEVQVQRSSGSQSQQVSDAIQQHVNRYIDSVTGGRNGDGWPMGAALVSFDLIHLISEVDNVEFVISLKLKGYQIVEGPFDNKPIQSLADDQWLITQTLSNGKLPKKQWLIIASCSQNIALAVASKASTTELKEIKPDDTITFDEFIIEELIGRVDVTLKPSALENNNASISCHRANPNNIGGYSET